ncbi:MAG: hypothetical protein AAGL18_04290 [Pseudomonadota bacterium]
MMIDETYNGEKPLRSEKHKIRHLLFGILVCTGMAHLIMTTFEVPNIGFWSNVRIFFVGAVYTALGLLVKYGDEKFVNYSAIACSVGMLSAIIEYAWTGSHYVATTLIIFDIAVIYYVYRFWSASDVIPTRPGQSDEAAPGA